MGVVLMWIWILVRYDTYPYDTNAVCCDNLCSSLLIYFRLQGLPRNCTPPYRCIPKRWIDVSKRVVCVFPVCFAHACGWSGRGWQHIGGLLEQVGAEAFPSL